MKRSIQLVLVALFAASSVLSACAAEQSIGSQEFDWFDAQPWELPDDAVEMEVHSVHDGDSLKLTKPNDDWWENYRIIGIQAPEIEGYKPQECGGQESAEFLRDLLPRGTTVWIQQDISDKDPNGRFLRHIFVEDIETGNHYLLSEILVLGGYARAREYRPDDLYDDVLAEAQATAWEHPENMWRCDEWKDRIRD